MSDTEPRRRLLPNDVRYLVLEGGGGKGHAYLGAVRALEELDVMPNIKGFGGASAGAITALMLSTGMDSKAIAEYMAGTDFDKFFEPPEPRWRPEAGSGGQPVEPEWTKIERAVELALTVSKFSLKRLLPLLGSAFAPELWEEVKGKLHKQPFKILLANWPTYAAFLGRDMGVFSGMEARKAWESLLRERMRLRGHRPLDGAVTFREHRRVFRKDLLMTGSNLSTGRTELFSARYTPDFPVADAVRISMSLPFIYKPYVIKGKRDGWPPCGTYVDGGLWNNLPFREFEREPELVPSEARASAAVPTGPPRPRTLALRLSIDPPTPVRNLGDLLCRIGQIGLFGSGESQVLAPYEDQTISLVTKGLDLVNFTPPPRHRALAVMRAHRAVYHYFHKPLKPEDQQPWDDFYIEMMFEAGRACP
ncbi:patatin-like phospholipase family protein [Streptomyces sp. NPDC046859]|uniref:patatin-like phospholipase family protein n=1 Tax=Streptomyces sp. NPDC046859 TaxID=3155734 RepID=UPI0033D35B32